LLPFFRRENRFFLFCDVIIHASDFE
jgi:hypothetical protein